MMESFVKLLISYSVDTYILLILNTYFYMSRNEMYFIIDKRIEPVLTSLLGGSNPDLQHTH